VPTAFLSHKTNNLPVAVWAVGLEYQPCWYAIALRPLYGVQEHALYAYADTPPRSTKNHIEDLEILAATPTWYGIA
jgi:hypothetical protein